LCSCFVRVPRPAKRPQPLGPSHRHHRPSVSGGRRAAGGHRPAQGPAASRGGERRAPQNPERPAADPALDSVASSFPAARRTRRLGRCRPRVDPPPWAKRRPPGTDPPPAARAISAPAAQIRLAGAAGAGGRLLRLAVAPPAGGAGDGRPVGRLAAGTAARSPAVPDAGGPAARSPWRAAARSARSAPIRRGSRSAAIPTAHRPVGRRLADRSSAAGPSGSFLTRLNAPAEPCRYHYDVKPMSAGSPPSSVRIDRWRPRIHISYVYQVR